MIGDKNLNNSYVHDDIDWLGLNLNTGLIMVTKSGSDVFFLWVMLFSIAWSNHGAVLGAQLPKCASS